MRWKMAQFALGAIDNVKAEADMGLVWNSQGQAQALVEQAALQSAVPELEERLQRLTAQIGAWEATRTTAENSDWDVERDRLVTELDRLRVNAASQLQDQHKKTQFWGVLIGASVVAVGSVGLFWVLRKRKKR